MNEIDNGIILLTNNTKNDIVLTMNKILTDANKVISENTKYGNNFINTLSISLKMTFPEATGYSPRNLARMKKFYETYKDLSNLPTALAKLEWSYNYILINSC